MFKLICYGVRENEVEFFHQMNAYHFQLTLVEDLLTPSNSTLAKGHQGVLLRGNCLADQTILEQFAGYGISYVFTRTVGYNHIDLAAAERLNIQVARVPAYSPNSVAELAVTLGMSLLRRTTFTTNRTAKKDFRVDPFMFSKEIRNCTVGIIGTGKIGQTEAALFKGLGAEVLGYDLYPSAQAEASLHYVPLDILLNESDIVSIHIPYIPGENEHFINAEFLAKMKPGAILINTARGPLQDEAAILAALKENHLSGFGTDVLEEETDYFFKKFDEEASLKNPVIEELIDLYPRVLITPHVGSNTDEALRNMISCSFDNFHQVLNEEACENLLTKKLLSI